MTIIESRLAEVLARPILSGSHTSWKSGACAVEMAAYLAGEKFSDAPACVCPVIRAFVTSWNDSIPTDEERTRLLRPYIARIVDTKSTREVEQKRADLALDWFIRVQTPAWLDLSPTLQPHAAAIRALAPVTSLAALQAAQPTLDAARSAAAAAWDAARDAAWAAAWDASRAASRAAACAAARDDLRSTVEQLQASALELIDRMLAVREPAA